MAVDAGAVIKQAQEFFAAQKIDEAEQVLRGALAEAPGSVPLLTAFARIERAQGRIRQAAALQQRLIDALPGDYVLRFDLAENLLLLGDFDRGWREYQHRYRLPHTKEIERRVQRPRWAGTPLDGQTILVHDEQGFGDSLQFMRLVPRVKARGGRVIFQVHRELLQLARAIPGVDMLLPRGAAPPDFSVHCELMSLPAMLPLRLSELPGPMPYLRPDPALVAQWRQRLAGLPRPLVALAWAGKPNHLNDKQRSLSLAAFAPLAAAPARFIAIQKGPTASEAATPPAGMRLLSLDPEIRSFDDTAAILTVADLLISIDSSPVHLAGALGRPVWTLLPLVPDWRWLLDRSDSPWYPSMRLFRQSRRGDWAPVIARVAEELAAAIARGRAKAAAS